MYLLFNVFKHLITWTTTGYYNLFELFKPWLWDRKWSRVACRRGCVGNAGTIPSDPEGEDWGGSPEGGPPTTRAILTKGKSNRLKTFQFRFFQVIYSSFRYVWRQACTPVFLSIRFLILMENPSALVKMK